MYTIKYVRIRGFTLIELALGMIIVGILIAGALQGFSLFIKQKKLSDVEKTYDSIQQGLRDFVLRDPDPLDGIPETNSRYPCPASPTAAPYSAAYGQEVCPTVSPGSCENEVCVVNGTSGLVYIGGVPTKTLGISASNATDPYGNRLTYAVTADLTVQGALSSPTTPVGAVTIDPTLGGTPITDAHFAVIMHGEDGAGSYTADGIPNPTPCRFGEAGDAENCDGDAVFSELERSIGDTPNFYDDAVAFTLSDGSADSYWGPINNNPQNIRNLNDTGIVCIGRDCDPATAGVGDVLLTSGHTHSGLDVIAERDVLAGQDVSAKRGLIVGGVSGDPDTIGTGSIVAGTGAIAVPTEGGIIVVEGKLGIGTNSPSQALHVITEQTSWDSPVALFENIGSGEIANIKVKANRPGGHFGRLAAGSTGSTLSTDGALTLTTGAPDVLAEGVLGTGTVRLTEDGNVGIGTADPQANLDVIGEIKIGNTGATCSATNEGAMRYNETEQIVEFCDGDDWRELGGGVPTCVDNAGDFCGPCGGDQPGTVQCDGTCGGPTCP